MTPIERVARALLEAALAEYRGIHDEAEIRRFAIIAARTAKDFEPWATAAIAALREPTEAMLKDNGTWAYALDEDAKGVWQSMIDAALKE